ncbi:type II toxin-antitoxin system HicA family toxin [Halopseudomonas salina]|uniref:HicA toxin of toxin-antitoxin n=1 Tax=Halopseudomonas salina TaxID=1323744 RepID=A0ABQ1P1K7_9GAMM|nr:hypothetical protein GCM10007418_03790 [Halopseudomonas salina]
MSRIAKLLEKLQRKPSPKDFTWKEITRVLEHFGYHPLQGAGSRVKFVHQNTKQVISLHKRHPDSTLLEYQIECVLAKLRDEGQVK